MALCTLLTTTACFQLLPSAVDALGVSSMYWYPDDASKQYLYETFPQASQSSPCAYFELSSFAFVQPGVYTTSD